MMGVETPNLSGRYCLHIRPGKPVDTPYNYLPALKANVQSIYQAGGRNLIRRPEDIGNLLNWLRVH